MAYVIRAAQATDALQLAAIRAHCNSRRMANSKAREEAQDVQFDPPQHINTLTLVYEEDGTLLGFVSAVCVPMLPLPGLGRTVWNVVELCVPEHETEGIVGAELLQEINRKAQASDGKVEVLW